MSATRINDRLVSWASLLEDNTREQAEATARLPIIEGHVALMPDAHLGMGATIGSVIPTESAVIPSAVGVDIGCGMAARMLDLQTKQLPDDLAPWVDAMWANVPAGLGKWNGEPTADAMEWMHSNPVPSRLEDEKRAAAQLGTLGSGNHFIELAEDEEGWVWILLHSGSRGGGNKLATLHTRTAKKLHEGLGTELEDPELAWLQEGTQEFGAYINDLRWAQSYAKENRRQLLTRTYEQVEGLLGRALGVLDEINCHHNYTTKERHGDKELWVTRKGAIRARVNDYGLIPGSMGQKSYVVKGLGNPLSYNSCSHGAGRTMSRRQARKTLTVETLNKKMAGSAWQDKAGEALLDEHPDSYKPIAQVMADQADLVEVVVELQAIANYKGTA